MSATFATAPAIRIPRDTALAIRRGHPWVFGGPAVPDPGSPVRLEHEGAVGWGLADAGPIRVRVLGRGAAPDRTVQDVLAERVHRADAFRWQVAPPETDCWRLLHGAGDGLPGLVADRYGSSVVLKIYSKAWVPYLDAITAALRLPWCGGVLRRFGVRNVDGRDGAQVLFGDVPDSVVVQEHGMRLLVRPRVGQKTGTFLDQREHRHRIRGIAAGREVVNLFAYHGGFSVAAAMGGASRVHTVDIAPDAIEDAREIFRLNGLRPEAHAFHVDDAFAWRPRGRVGLWILDPPSLARAGAKKNAARRAYAKLHRRLDRVLVRDGLLATSSCTAQISWEDWLQAIREGLGEHGSWSWLEQSRAPWDHPVALAHREGAYLKFAVLRLLDAREA